MKFRFGKNRASFIASMLCIGIMLLLMVFLFFFDHTLSHNALLYRTLAENEESTLGEFFQIVRLFGKADVLILLALILGLAGKRHICKQIIIALILVGVMVHPVKNIVGRERPDHSSHTSFPSGDTATAFVLPEILTASTTSVVASSIVATGVAVSRVFYQRHFPSDVVAGALVGLLAGFLSILLSNRINWVPSRFLLLLGLCVLFLYFAVAGIMDSHHRHDLQFIVWFCPSLLLFLLRPYIVLRYPQKNRQIISGRLYYFIKDSMYGCSLTGVGAILIPWFTGMSGIRAPLLSLGLGLLVYSYYMRKELKSARISAMLALSGCSMFIAEFWILGYLLGKF